MPAFNTRIATPTGTGEDFVNVLHVLFFDATGTQLFIDVMESRNDDGSPLDLTMLIHVQFRDAPTLNHSTDYKLLLVTNVDAYVSNVDA